MEDLEAAILARLTPRTTVSEGVLQTQTMRALGHKLDPSRFSEALRALADKHLISIKSGDVRLKEPDFPENSLEPPIEAWLGSKEFFGMLGLDAAHTVWQTTARGGQAGTGIWSRPDFSVATIRRRKYDPVRHLDLFAIELKNLAGTSVVSVHEALAHTRFAHYAYLLCPRSKIEPQRLDVIEEACSQHGVGLITFSIDIQGTDRPCVRDFDFAIAARRKSPEPSDIDNYIDARFDPDNCARLLRLAEGT